MKPGTRPQVNCVRYCMMQRKQKTGQPIGSQPLHLRPLWPAHFEKCVKPPLENFLNVIKLFIQKFSFTDSVAIATGPGDGAATWSASCLLAAAPRCVRCWRRGRGRSFSQREEVGEGLPVWQETSTYYWTRNTGTFL